MGDYDYAPAVFDDEDEEQLRLRNGGYTPVVPAAPPAEPGSPASAMAPPVASSAPMPAVGSLDDLESRAAMPHVYAPVTPDSTPAQTRLKDLTAQGAPPVEPLHGWKRALDVASQLTRPTQAIEQAVRFGPQRAYARNLAQAQGDVEAENLPQKETAATDLSKAQTEQNQSRAELENEQAAALRKTGGVKPVKTPQEVYADAVQEAVKAGRDPSKDPKVLQLADTITAIQKPPAAPKPAHVTYDSGIPVSVTDKDGNVFDVNDPKLPPELTPLVTAASRAHGQHVTEESNKQAAAFAQQEKMHDERQSDLTAASKSMVEAAPKVLKLAQRIDPLIDKLKDELGPEAGRWNEFWAGRVGAKNPEYTKLRTDVGLLSTALMRMHVGARGGELMMQHFKDLIDSGKQSPENLKAALGEIVQYAQDVQAEGHGGHGGGENKGGEAIEYKPGLVRNGYKFNGGDPTDKANWEQVKKP